MRYFISYMLTNEMDNSFGVSNNVVDLNGAIVSMEDVRSIEAEMQKIHHGEHVSLIMYKEIVE